MGEARVANDVIKIGACFVRKSKTLAIRRCKIWNLEKFKFDALQVLAHKAMPMSVYCAL